MRRLLFECYDRTFEGMTDSEWRVFCAICKHANDDTGGDCFPSTLLLAKESRLHKNTVPPQIRSLEEKKWIRIEQESGKRRYFFVDVGRILSCPRIGSNDSVPLQEPVPLNNSVPLQEPVADGYRKIEGTGTESCTRRDQLKEQEENISSSSTIGSNDSVPLQEPVPLNNSVPLQEPVADGYRKIEGTGTESCTRRDQLKEQEENISSSSTSDPEPLTLTNDETPAACTRKKATAVPFAQIVEIYNEKLGNDLGICRKLSETRKSVLRQRWKDVGEIVESSDPKEILSGFGCYYDKIARSSFLMGRATNFKATFDWIHKSENFIKTYEGNYENGRYRN